VGHRTANGHVIQPRDHFVALPSASVLSSRNGYEFQVRITYNGRSTIAPVWDVGPWNERDDYWNENRLVSDLPRFLPQAQAAYEQRHNGGRDLFGRRVTQPAGIDLADGVFWDALGMVHNDWVEVEFLWLAPLEPAPTLEVEPIPVPEPEATPSPRRRPLTARRWYFAAGSTAPPLRTELILQNGEPEPASVVVTYLLGDLGVVEREYEVRPFTHRRIDVNGEVTEAQDVSMIVASDLPIFAERAFYREQDGRTTVGARAPATRWYFADGPTTPPYETWLVVFNPGEEAASVTARLYPDEGEVVEHTFSVAAGRRETVGLNDLAPGTTVSIVVDADAPVVAETAIYSAEGQGNDGVLGVTEPSDSWYFAEGSGVPDDETFLTLFNPTADPIKLSLTYYLRSGFPEVTRHTLAPTSRLSVHVNHEVAEPVGIEVQATGPIVAQRSMYFMGGRSAAAGSGAIGPAKRWYLPEGRTDDNFHQYLLLLNPGDIAAEAVISLEDANGVESNHLIPLEPASRVAVRVADLRPDADGGTVVESDQPIVVERTTYYNNALGATTALGIPDV